MKVEEVSGRGIRHNQTYTPVTIRQDYVYTTLPSKALVQIQQRNQKLYRQAKAKRIQHHQTSLTPNAKGTSRGWGAVEGRPQLETRKSQMGKLTSKGNINSRKSPTHKYDIKTSNCEESTNAGNGNCI